MDIERLIGAVTRIVRRETRDGVEVTVLIAERDYDARIEDAWDALTNPVRISRWFLPVEGDLREGGHYSLAGNASGEIRLCRPPDRLEIGWDYGGETSDVTVSLATHGDLVRLTLEHAAVVKPEFWDLYGPGATGLGWELGLVGLDMHFRSPESRAPESVPGWAVSDEAKGFYRASGTAWGEASIPLFPDPAAARAAAQRTIAAYSRETSG